MKAALFLLGLLLLGCARHTVILQDTPPQKAYGQVFYHNESGVPLSFPGSGVYVNQTYVLGSSCSGLACPDHRLIVQKAARYSAEYHISFAGSPNKEYHATMGVNGVDKDECHGARMIGSGGDVGNMGGTCQLDLEPGDVVTLMIENEDAGTGVTIQDSSFNLVLI